MTVVLLALRIEKHKRGKEILMVVYVFRHGEAVDADESLIDEWRYLTARGRKATEAVAGRLAHHGLSMCQIVSSPLVRAVQTAQIVAQSCGPAAALEINGLLLPGGNLSELVSFVRSYPAKHVMVVGHEPQLGMLVTGLLEYGQLITLKKSSCVILEIERDKPDKPAQFCSYAVPGTKPVKSLKKAFGKTSE
ncbi:phosphohistidine phosphatase SixA [Pelotalea chapellei]|uniref:Phosphohistidine phosphatase SixA n=1 Tax=Pelotalea chapellei TaxID=44671 RepID=A0ABS5U6H7_9BACT|nr:phosphohistidine phosphatase SixA [Pelotalea chapellei]MBT1071256.1 phosphohistidine phosphatase SixA [Pelotalea chapellei]